MADEVGNSAQKRKLDDVEVNWPASELEQALEKRRKLEEAEPYNDEEVRQKAKEIGIDKAMRSSASEVSKVSQNVAPRGLSSTGDESSEFVSADEAEGVVVEDLNSMQRGTEDEILADSDVDEEDEDDDEGKEPDAAEDEEARRPRKGQMLLPKPTPPPEGRDIIADMMANSDAVVARIMQGYSLPSRARQADASRGSSEEEEADDIEQDEGGEEETQVVQDSMAVDADPGLATPPVDRDSGHGSMEEAEAEIGADDQEEETAPESADYQPLTNGSQDWMSAVEETIRQIKAERSAGATANTPDDENVDGQGVATSEVLDARLVSGDDQERKRFVAERKENKKQRVALASQQKRELASQAPHATPQAVRRAAPARAVAKTTTQVLKSKRNRKTRSSKATPLAIISAQFAEPKPKRTRQGKRRVKRVRRAEEMQCAAREDPKPYIKRLQEKIVFVHELPDEAGEAAKCEREIAVRKSRRAEVRLQRFEELVARIQEERELGFEA